MRMTAGGGGSGSTYTDSDSTTGEKLAEYHARLGMMFSGGSDDSQTDDSPVATDVSKSRNEVPGTIPWTTIGVIAIAIVVLLGGGR